MRRFVEIANEYYALSFMNHVQRHTPEKWRAILACGQSCSAVSIRSAHTFYGAEDYCTDADCLHAAADGRGRALVHHYRWVRL